MLTFSHVHTLHSTQY